MAKGWPDQAHFLSITGKGLGQTLTAIITKICLEEHDISENMIMFSI